MLVPQLFLFLAIFSCGLLFSFEGWTHLELGAGNYGADGHTKASQVRTVLMKFREVTSVKNYIDDLEEAGRGYYKPEEQYGVLFWTLDQLVGRYGDAGVFHVNDLYEDYANLAVCRLKEYAAAKGYHSVAIEAVPGDYQFLDSEKTLGKYGKKKYQSVHLKNPEITFYHDKMDGDYLFASQQSRQETRLLLCRLAHLSEEGLYLFIPYHEDFIPIEERTEFMERHLFYRQNGAWGPVPYIFPEGNEISVEDGRVFFIPAI